jgi:hypothetical protein
LQHIPELGELDAHGRLRIVQALRGACHIELGQQHIECEQQIEIELPEAIIHSNT